MLRTQQSQTRSRCRWLNAVFIGRPAQWGNGRPVAVLEWQWMEIAADRAAKSGKQPG